MIGCIASAYREGSRWLYRSFCDAYSDVVKVHHEAPFDVAHAYPGLNIGWVIARDLEMYDVVWPDMPLVHVVRNGNNTSFRWMGISKPIR